MKGILITLGIFIFSLFFSSLNLFAQKSELEKNIISWDYSFYVGEKNGGGEIIAQGIVLGYSRYFTSKIYGNLSYGLMNFEGRNSNLYLDKSETNFINMRIFTLGGGYEIFQSEHFLLSGELAYFRQTNEQILSISGSPNQGDYFRETGIAKDETLRLSIKPRIFVNDHLEIIPTYSRGFGFGKYKSEWLSIGLGYKF